LAEIIVGKQRNGPVGNRELYFVKDYARFENLTQASSDPFGDATAAAEDTTDDSASAPPTHNPGGGEKEATFRPNYLRIRPRIIKALFISCVIRIACSGSL